MEDVIIESPKVVYIGGSAQKIDDVQHDPQQEEMIRNFIPATNATSSNRTMMFTVFNADVAYFAMLFYH